jgi:predicted ArsR family transcriptional regulator
VSLDRLAAAGDPRLRQVLNYARAEHAPFTTDEAAAALNVHRTVARRRLDQLVTAGFLDVTRERRDGRSGPGAGRPAKVYRVAPELEGVEFPDRRYAGLVGILAEKIPQRARDRALRQAGEEFGHLLAARTGLKKSANLANGLAQICDALGSLGFPVSVRTLDRDQATLTTPACPLRPLVVEQAAGSAIDQGMWTGLIECGLRFKPDGVECDTARCRSQDESCQILVSLRSHDRGAFRGPASR